MYGSIIFFKYDRLGTVDRDDERNPVKRAKDILAKLDRNNDKKLNKEEFINGSVLIN
jgi:hypothetical protein